MRGTWWVAAALGMIVLMSPPRQAIAQQGAGPGIGSPLDLEVRVEELDQKIRILERLLEIARDSAAAALKQAPRVAAGRDGFVFGSSDADFQLRLRGYAQADGRSVGAPPGGTANSSLFLRRVRPIIEVTGWRYFNFRLMTDFGGGRVLLYDAHLDFRPSPAFTLRAGKTKPPIGLERLRSATDLQFAERGLPTNLVPNRDVGVQVLGDLAGGRLSYAAGVFDGVPDLAIGDGDVTGDKDLVGRVFVQPFLSRPSSPFRGFGIGIAASSGNEHGTVSATALPVYVTPAQQQLFRYRDSTVADGRRSRIAPQGYFYSGPFGILGEYVVSHQTVSRSALHQVRLGHTSWQVAGSWYLTGERASFTTVAPRHPFDLRAGTWGALEVGVRYGKLTPDSTAFPAFANASVAVREATALGAEVTWHLARGQRIGFNYERTQFTGGSSVGDRPAEHALTFRIQQAF